MYVRWCRRTAPPCAEAEGALGVVAVVEQVWLWCLWRKHKFVRTQSPELYRWILTIFCVLNVLWCLTTVPPINRSTRSSGGNGGITSDGGEGYVNLPVMWCRNFTTTQRNFTVFGVGGVGWLCRSVWLGLVWWDGLQAMFEATMGARRRKFCCFLALIIMWSLDLLASFHQRFE